MSNELNTFKSVNCIYFNENEQCLKKCYNSKLCDKHLNDIQNISKYVERDRILCVNDTKRILSNLELIKGKENKIKEVLYFFEFIILHKAFLDGHQKFSEILYDKLKEFKNESDVFIQYFSKIFGDTLYYQKYLEESNDVFDYPITIEI